MRTRKEIEDELEVMLNVAGHVAEAKLLALNFTIVETLLDIRDLLTPKP